MVVPGIEPGTPGIASKISDLRTTEAVHKIIIEISNTFLSRMFYSGMSRRVALVRADFSEESIASIIRVTRICELGTT
jgi:hypothetical protein